MEHKGSEIIIINYVVRPGRMYSIVLMDCLHLSMFSVLSVEKACEKWTKAYNFRKLYTVQYL